MNAPTITLSGAALRENVRVWKRHANVAVRAVVKADGYGFGLERLVRELDGVVDGFVVSDVEELERLRKLTDAPAATLHDGGPQDACRAADLAGIVNVARLDSLAALTERSNASETTLRIGLRLAAGWSAIDTEDAERYASQISGSNMSVELWTHLINTATETEDRERFKQFVAVFRKNGVEVVGEDAESTFPAARGVFGSSVRIGIGLFGSGLSGRNNRLTCAIDVRAPVIDRVTSNGTLGAGYGTGALSSGSSVSVLRCGYSDGFPRVIRPYRDILSVGMQYCIVQNSVVDREAPLLGRSDDIDELAAASNVLPHQVVTGLGLAFQRQVTPVR